MFANSTAILAVSRHLDRKRRIYVEYSNELWNAGFEQCQFVIDEGRRRGFSSSPWEAGWRFGEWRRRPDSRCRRSHCQRETGWSFVRPRSLTPPATGESLVAMSGPDVERDPIGADRVGGQDGSVEDEVRPKAEERPILCAERLALRPVGEDDRPTTRRTSSSNRPSTSGSLAATSEPCRASRTASTGPACRNRLSNEARRVRSPASSANRLPASFAPSSTTVLGGAQAANAIPTEARASIDLRLVPDQKPQAVREAVERHLAAQGFFVTREEPDMPGRLAHARIVRVEWKAGYPGVRAPMDQPFARAVATVIGDAMRPIVRLPILGGSVPLSTLQDTLGKPVVIVPIVNHDNNQHAANENLRLRNLWDGMVVFSALFTGLAAAWP